MERDCLTFHQERCYRFCSILFPVSMPVKTFYCLGPTDRTAFFPPSCTGKWNVETPHITRFSFNFSLTIANFLTHPIARLYSFSLRTTHVFFFIFERTVPLTHKIGRKSWISLLIQQIFFKNRSKCRKSLQLLSQMLKVNWRHFVSYPEILLRLNLQLKNHAKSK